MNKNIIDKLYYGFWCSTTILIGIMAGFMISHFLVLGRFFNWFIESGNVDLLRQTFSVFRGTGNYSFFILCTYLLFYYHLSQVLFGLCCLLY